MTKTAVGAEEPDDENNDYEAVVSSFDGKVTVYSNGKMIISYPTSSTGSMGHAIISNTITSGNISVQPLTQTSPTPTVLFGDWIEKTKYLQEGFYGHKFEDFTQEELEQWVRTNVLAAEDELHEALGEISWKPWATAKFFNREAYLGEIVDVLHFVGNLLAGAGISDAELNEAYLAKMERNRQRQREGYTGIQKCILCKRAVDDIEAHGGRVTWSRDGSNPEIAQCEDCEGKM